MILHSLIVTGLLTGAPAPEDPPKSYFASTPTFPALTDLTQHDLHPIAVDEPYFRVSTGVVRAVDSNGPANQDVEFDNGFLFSLGLGKRVMKLDHGLDICAEFDGVLTKTDAHTQGAVNAVGDVGVAALLFDGLLNYHFAFDPRLSLYGGFGLGAAMLDVNTNSDAAHDFDAEDGPFLAWQAKTGAAWRFAPHVAVHAGLRFLRVQDAHVDDNIGNSDFDLETRKSVLEAGLLFDI